jgi:hypothetical protein
MPEPLLILSLGAGVQSSTVLLMSCRGELPKLDAAIFADTQWEPAAVYEHLAWLEIEAKAAGIPVHRVSAGNLRADALSGQVVGGRKAGGNRFASMPLFTLATDAVGRVKRQCTSHYKIEPIERFIRREILSLKPGERAPSNAVDQWFGISADELRRVRMSTDAWKRNVYPLCGLPDPMLPKAMTRRGCLAWLADKYPARPVPRSACIGCPYHSNEEWSAIQKRPDEWADAVGFDKAIRAAGGMRGEFFLHRSCKPLEDVDLRSDVERGQRLLWNEECLGMCGV